MSTHRHPQIVSRKKTTNTVKLIAAILQAATLVLAEEGIARFTMARVPEKAGVSVGSIYQYFPNTVSILFRLQVDEWIQTTRMMQSILKDVSAPPLERLRTLVHAFLQSECEEAEIRSALNDAAPLYRDSPEAHMARTEGSEMIDTFMENVLPGASLAARKLAGELIFATLKSIGNSFSLAKRTKAEITAYADATADMFCAYLKSIEGHSPL